MGESVPLDKPALGSNIIAAVAEFKDVNGNPIIVPIAVDTNFSPARLIVELPDRALRDLGKVDIAENPSSSIFRSIDLDEGACEVVSTVPCGITGMWVTNTATTTRFIKFYDATSGTIGTGTPVITFGIPGNTSDDIAGLTGGCTIGFLVGCCVGASTGVADNDTGAPGVNDVVVNIFFKT